MPTEAELIAERMRKLAELREQKINPYPYRFERTHNSGDIKTQHQGLQPHTWSGKTVSTAGRVVSLRRMGKVTFGHIQDQAGRLQLYFSSEKMGMSYGNLKLVDIGDFVGVTGEVFCTKTSEITIDVKECTMLAKAIRPLPDKWGGLKDIEARYRKRYLDLIMNPGVADTFRKRAAVLETIRKTLGQKDFLEVDTPVLQPVYGGANALPFETILNALKMKMYLRIAIELYLKRVLVGGVERVFEIARNFRNEDIDRSHNPEFTMMECYQAYADLSDMMTLTEELFTNACMVLHGKTAAPFGQHTIDYKAPWKRITMVDAVKEYAGIDIANLMDEDLFAYRTTYNLEIEGDLTRGKMITALFEELVEDKLIQPTLVTEHPKETTPLAKVSRANPLFVERFELFIGGMEIANAYSELNDPIIQRMLLEEQAKQLRGGMEEAHPMDEDFIESMEYGMPPAGGVGIGIDRMVMLLTNNESIRDVILFPFMKPKEAHEHKS